MKKPLPKPERFVIGKPVPGGSQYHELTDTENNITLASLHISIPKAKAFISVLRMEMWAATKDRTKK